MSGRGAGRRVAFVTATLSRPTGGDFALFELANAVARLGNYHVAVVHLPFGDWNVTGRSDLAWFDFEPSVEHRFGASFADELPDAELVVCTTKVVAAATGAAAGRAGAGFLDRLREQGPGVPPRVLFLQGLGVFGTEVERLAAQLPGSKLCVSRWLAGVMVEQGAAAADVVVAPNGVDPETFAVTRSIRSRRPQVAMNYDPHPVKGGLPGLDALRVVHSRTKTPAAVFGTRPPPAPLEAGLEFIESPSRTTLARDVYNASSIYLQPSVREGFGMCAVEAMACGCALVTTDNGGSAEYARDGETALVCESEPAAMADAVIRLLRDDRLRRRIARNGSEFVDRFRWATSAAALVALAASPLQDDR